MAYRQVADTLIEKCLDLQNLCAMATVPARGRGRIVDLRMFIVGLDSGSSPDTGEKII